MKKKQLSFALLLALVVSAAIMPSAAFCAEDDATIDPSRKGSITIEYMTSDGKMPVSGANFVIRRIAEPAVDKIGSDGSVNGVIWVSLLGTMESNEYTDADVILKAAKETYLNGDPKVGGKTYSGLTNSEGKLFLDGIEQGLYVAEEVGSAKGYLESEPFVFSIPYIASKSLIYPLDSLAEGTEALINITPDNYDSSGKTGHTGEDTGKSTDQERSYAAHTKTEEAEFINHVSGQNVQISDRQYWSYAVFAQPKARKKPEAETPGESTPIHDETTEAETDETDILETEIPETRTTEIQDTELSSEFETPSESYTEPYSDESESNSEKNIQESTQDIEPPTPSGGKKRDTTVKTGDESNTWLFLSVSLISVGIATILAAVITERRRRQYEKE